MNVGRVIASGIFREIEKGAVHGRNPRSRESREGDSGAEIPVLKRNPPWRTIRTLETPPRRSTDSVRAPSTDGLQPSGTVRWGSGAS